MKKFIAIIVAMLAINVFAIEAKTVEEGIETCLTFLETKEGFRSTWYCDKCQRGLAGPDSVCQNKKCFRLNKRTGKLESISTPTIGHGLTKIYWKGGSISREQSRAIKRRIVRADAMAIVAAARVDLNSNQIAALCSLAYRRGVSAVLRSKTFAAVQREDASAITREWKGFNTSGGVVMRGLINRCNDELKLFFK